MSKLDILSRALGYANYEAYLVSDHWLTFSNKVRMKFCYVCDGEHILQVHHLTYERLGKELPTDVITVCKGCHNQIHERVRNKQASLETAHYGLCRKRKKNKQKAKANKKKGRKPKVYANPSQFSDEIKAAAENLAKLMHTQNGTLNGQNHLYRCLLVTLQKQSKRVETAE